jgi:WD40 repeat protein/serine/threonine protein kinase
MSTSPGSADYGRFDELAEEFVKRYRRGERPSLEAYVRRLPEMADEIRQMFPALAEVEQAEDDARRDASARGLPAAPHLRQIGDYRIIREIGRGGMGIVYEAEQISLGRRVALKVLPPHMSGDQMTLERFRRESRAAARLHHTNIVPVYEVGQEANVRFYAMQFIQGQSLDMVINELRRLRERSGAAPEINEAAHGGAGRPRPGRSYLGIEDSSLSATDLVRPVLQSILTGRFEPGGRFAARVEASDEALAKGAQGDLTTQPGTGVVRRAAEADPALARTEEAESAPARDVIGPERMPSPSSDPSSSASPFANSAILPGATQLSSVESSRREIFRSLAHIGRQVAGGLAFAHARGIVHRDIKPSNLLLDTEGVVWITDFGLAKGDDEGLTQTGDILGTVRYMAPERFKGEGDARADVYALGLTLYELLTLRPVFGASDRLKLIDQIKTDEPVRPRTIDGRIPRDLETIVLKAIEKDPKARYQSAEVMAEDLGRFLAGEPIRARQVSGVERSWRWCQRNKAVALLLGGIALALLLGTALSTHFALRATRGEWLAQQKAAEARESARLATREAQRARDAELESDQRLYVADINLAQQAWQEGRLDAVQQALHALEPKRPEDPDRRGFEWYYLQRLCQLDLRTLGGVNTVVFSPDGSRIASASDDCTVKLWDAATGRENLTLSGHSEPVSRLAFSPDGRQIASASPDRTIKLWDAATGREVRTLRGHLAAVWGVAFSADGSQIASVGGDWARADEPGEMRIWDAASGRKLHGMRVHNSITLSVAFSSDGRRIATASWDCSVKLWDATTWRELRTCRGHSDAVWGVAFGPDGRHVASASRDRTVKLWDASTGQEVVTVRGHSAAVLGVAFSPDGRRLATASRDRTVKLWDAVTGQEVLTLRGHAEGVSGVSFSPDGRCVASVSLDRTVKLWDAATDHQVLSLRGHSAGVTGVVFSPDGRRLASASVDRTVKIWDIATDQESLSLRGHSEGVTGVAFSPDGRRVASASSDRTVKVWDAATGQEILTLRGHRGEIAGVAFSPDGRRLASAGWDRTVKLWDADTGREVLSLHGHSGAVLGVSFSPDSRRVASASHDHSVKLWDVATGQELRTLSGHSEPVSKLAFSPDGRRIASASWDRTVKLWDISSGQEVLTARGHTEPVDCVAFSPDGSRIVSGSFDRTIKLWDAATGEERLTLRGHSRAVLGVAFSPDGHRIASAGRSDLAVQIWDATPLTPELRAQGEARVVVEFLCAQSLSVAEVLDRIRHDPGLSAPVRQLACEQAAPYGRSLVAHEAERQVYLHYALPLLRPQVLEHLRANPSISEPVRQEALALAESAPEYPHRLGEASRGVVRRPGAAPTDYRLALRQAEAACRGLSESSELLTILGMAQYRVGQYGEAAATLTQADRLSADAPNGPIPMNLAFLALAQHRLGQSGAARVTMGRLQAAMNRPEWASNEGARDALRETEAIQHDLAFPADPFVRAAGGRDRSKVSGQW